MIRPTFLTLQHQHQRQHQPVALVAPAPAYYPHPHPHAPGMAAAGSLAGQPYPAGPTNLVLVAGRKTGLKIHSWEDLRSQRALSGPIVYGFCTNPRLRSAAAGPIFLMASSSPDAGEQTAQQTMQTKPAQDGRLRDRRDRDDNDDEASGTAAATHQQPPPATTTTTTTAGGSQTIQSWLHGRFDRLDDKKPRAAAAASELMFPPPSAGGATGHPTGQYEEDELTFPPAGDGGVASATTAATSAAAGAKYQQPPPTTTTTTTTGGSQYIESWLHSRFDRLDDKKLRGGAGGEFSFPPPSAVGAPGHRPEGYEDVELTFPPAGDGDETDGLRPQPAATPATRPSRRVAACLLVALIAAAAVALPVALLQKSRTGTSDMMTNPTQNASAGVPLTSSPSPSSSPQAAAASSAATASSAAAAATTAPTATSVSPQASSPSSSPAATDTATPSPSTDAGSTATSETTSAPSTPTTASSSSSTTTATAGNRQMGGDGVLPSFFAVKSVDASTCMDSFDNRTITIVMCADDAALSLTTASSKVFRPQDGAWLTPILFNCSDDPALQLTLFSANIVDGTGNCFRPIMIGPPTLVAKCGNFTLLPVPATGTGSSTVS
ncbi:hypothetical protein DFJ73DRAFT_802153 [Zopfochytrium polystomum]|nr:hypothetical protein DFJ73DRAFT_802153 [Zopfochytrium polystomum]